MLFNSFQFLIFLPVVILLYFILPHKYRWVMLLAASCFFYMFFIPVYILILFFTIIIDYIAGILIEKTEEKNKKKYLIMSLIANIGILCVFKYYNFFIENINQLLDLSNFKTNLPLLSIILPIGLSFHTFQAMSYTIEVYRGNQKAERHFGIYALYVMFFPQLVAGPIERPQNMLHQFYEKHQFNYTNFVLGFQQIIWGLFKKAVIADRLALIVDPIFNNPTHSSGIGLCIATILFAFEIFCDFSGYSDIALGCAKMLGFNLMVNFDRPYSSKNVTEFWRRWHISLSTWFKDYLYIPLGGNRVSMVRLNINILIVFLISGLWHGAAWHYIVWGALHGLALIYEVFTRNLRKRFFSVLPSFLSLFIGKFFTFIYVSFAWIFFRANTLKDAIYIVKKLPNSVNDLIKIVSSHKHIFDQYLPQNVSVGKLTSCFYLILFLEFLHYFSGKINLNEFVYKCPTLIRWSIYIWFIYYVVLFGVFNNKEFIYFQF